MSGRRFGDSGAAGDPSVPLDVQRADVMV
jgi:hypothetical protein